MTQTVQANSLVTLHYRIALPNGQPLINTFDGTPATLQLGADEMLPALEQVLLGLALGAREQFALAPEQAFGPYRDELVERVARVHLPPDAVEAPSVMEFTAPDGQRYTGLLRELGDEFAIVDFNHPLAGKSITLDVEIIGIN